MIITRDSNDSTCDDYVCVWLNRMEKQLQLGKFAEGMWYGNKLQSPKHTYLVEEFKAKFSNPVPRKGCTIKVDKLIRRK